MRLPQREISILLVVVVPRKGNVLPRQLLVARVALAIGEVEEKAAPPKARSQHLERMVRHTVQAEAVEPMWIATPQPQSATMELGAW